MVQNFSSFNIDDINEFSEKRQLPHNFIAEQMVLSNLLISAEAIEIANNTLSINAFYFKNHQEIYKAILSLYNEKGYVDTLILITFLQDNGILKKIGGIQVLIELINKISYLTNFENYLGLVKEKFLRRCLIKLGYELISSSYTTNLKLEKIINESEEKIFNLTTQIQPQNLKRTGELLDTIFLELKEKSLNPTFPGLTSGFYKLDSLTQGFQKSDLIILAGRPSMGKTALSLNIVINILKKLKLPILFFTMEMSKEQIIYRLISLITQINQVRLKTGRLDKIDWKKITKALEILAKLPLFIDDTANLSVKDIELKIKPIFFEKKKIGLIFIDYLQLMQGEKTKTENRTQEMTQITRSLKALARKFNIPIVALSQLSRSVESRVDKRPKLSDLRESGSIEQDADLVLILHKVQQLRSKAIELIIAKHRNGPTGTVKLYLGENGINFLNDDSL